MGAACMLDGMVARMEEELGYSATVIATGGIAKFVVPMCRREIIYDKELVLFSEVLLAHNCIINIFLCKRFNTRRIHLVRNVSRFIFFHKYHGNIHKLCRSKCYRDTRGFDGEYFIHTCILR